jgi:hypothetical protein
LLTLSFIGSTSLRLENLMRTIFALTAALALTACATQAPAPTPTPAPAAAPAPAKAEMKAPQCWHADNSAFVDVGVKATISGVKVECKATTDGKSAQWMGNKH